MDQTPEYCLSPTCSALFQTRSMLQEITEQNDRLEAVNRDLNASRNDWKALAESKSARVAELEALLHRARAVIPDKFEDEIQVRADINRYFNAHQG